MADPACPRCNENPVNVCEQPVPLFGVTIKFIGRFEVWLWKDRPQEMCMDCLIEIDNQRNRVGLDEAFDCGFERGYGKGLRDA